MQPLAGITILALEQAVAAPFATRQLADLGARVIKIERRGTGDFARHFDAAVKGLSSNFVWLNRSKESVTLDLKHPAAVEILDRLLARSDVFIQNLLPGATARLGLDAETLRDRYPRLIVCDLTGYGSSGPYAQKKAYDLLIQNETGLLSVTGTPDAVARTGVSIADISGGMYAFSAILTALYTRERTGNGPHIEVSLFDALSEWMSQPMYYSLGGAEPPRTGPNHPSIAPYGPFPLAGGDRITIGIQNDREWRRLCSDVLERPDLADDPRFATNVARVGNRGELHAVIENVFSSLSREEVASRLDRAQVAYADLKLASDLPNHPQILARNRLRSVESPAGSIPALLPPAIISDVETRLDPIPSLGEHTDAVLHWLGYDDQEIAALKTTEVI